MSLTSRLTSGSPIGNEPRQTGEPSAGVPLASILIRWKTTTGIIDVVLGASRRVTSPSSGWSKERTSGVSRVLSWTVKPSEPTGVACLEIATLLTAYEANSFRSVGYP